MHELALSTKQCITHGTPGVAHINWAQQRYCNCNTQFAYITFYVQSMYVTMLRWNVTTASVQMHTAMDTVRLESTKIGRKKLTLFWNCAFIGRGGCGWNR